MTREDEAGGGRLDIAMVAAGLVPTRSRARDLIGRGYVTVNGRLVTKPGATVTAMAHIALGPDAPQFVSRGAEKLAAALSAFSFEPMGLCALDVGASTGGFTEILLQHGVRRVYAVDVGHDQLHPRLRADGRVVVLERTDARSLSPERVPEAVSAIVADLSFISLTKALGPALALSAPGAWLVALIKPQFEVGRDAVGKGGVVSDPAARARAVETVQAWLETVPGWRAAGIVPSPITGGDGNAEFLLGARYEGQGQ